MENNIHELQDQLLDYYAGAKAASNMYFEKSKGIDNFGFQGIGNLSPEGVGGFAAIGGLVGKLAYAGARLVETTCNTPESFSDLLNTTALPLNAVAGTIFAAGVSIMAGSVIKDFISRRVEDKGNFLKEQADYALMGYSALRSGSLNISEGATMQDVLMSIREKEVADYLASDGDPENVEDFYPEVDMSRVEKFIGKVENAQYKEDVELTKSNTLSMLERLNPSFVAGE